MRSALQVRESEALGEQGELVRGKLQESDSRELWRRGTCRAPASLGTRSWPPLLPAHPGDPGPPLRRLTCPRGVRVRSAPPPYPSDRWHQRPDPETPPPGWRGWRRSGPAPGNHTPHCRRRPLVQCPPLPSHWQMAVATMLEGFQGAGGTGRRRRVRYSGEQPPGLGRSWLSGGVFSCSIPLRRDRPPQSDSQHSSVALRTSNLLPGCGLRVFEPLSPEASQSNRLRDS